MIYDVVMKCLFAYDLQIWFSYAYGILLYYFQMNAIPNCFRIQKCFKILPYVGGTLLVGLIAFALWVRSVPPAPDKLETTPAMPQQQRELDLDMLKNMDPETQEMLKNMDPETLLKMGAKLESDDGDGMATPSKDGDDETVAAAANDGAPPLDDEEEISLDDEEPPAAAIQEEEKVEEQEPVAEEKVEEAAAAVEEEAAAPEEPVAAQDEPIAEELPPEEQRNEEL